MCVETCIGVISCLPFGHALVSMWMYLVDGLRFLSDFCPTTPTAFNGRDREMFVSFQMDESSSEVEP